MRVAIFADIHANRQAFEACLADASKRGAEEIVLLGDYVGYGGDPEWCLETARRLVGQGAVAVRGNHDDAVNSSTAAMNETAALALEWTRRQLGPEQRRFLAALPFTAERYGCLFVHADPSRPRRWIYVTDSAQAALSLVSTDAELVICGHVHQPALYSASETGKMTAFRPRSDIPIPLGNGRRWLAVLGAVGQPRDGDPQAAWAMLDTAPRALTFCRTPYNVDAAAESIRRQGLPSRLADRLYVGR